ncbi:MAG: hypothetical protein AUK63_591 [bacterium P3]|nr:MAG: hypothetical protein AUK63_591 [bacterium P3]KWW42047.1 MAG: hypothetical protein F083_698 [bacterium F083]
MNQRAINLLLTLLLLSTAALAQKNTGWQQRENSYRQAQDLFIKEKYAVAQQLFDELASRRQGVTAQTADDAAYYAAVCANKLGNDDAEHRLLQFLKKHPQSIHTNMARLQLGHHYYRHGKYKEALAWYRQVDKHEVEFGYRSEYEFKNAYCLFTEGDYKKAKPVFAQLLSGQNKYRNPSRYYYAHIQYMDGEYEQALNNFQTLKADRNFARLIPSYEARLYFYLGRYDELLQMVDALMEDPELYRRDEIAQMVAEVHYNRGRYSEALPYYRTATQLSQQPVAGSHVCTPQDNNYQMGYCYYMTHLYDSAAAYLLKKTVCDDSIAQHALYTLGDIYLKQGKKDAARSVFLQASRMNYNATVKEDALFNYAKLSCELNKNPYNESIRSFQDYLAQYPGTSHREEIQEILASLYLTTRNYKDALTLIEGIHDRSVALNRAYQHIVLNRGIEIFNTGAETEAVEYFKKAAQLNVDPRVTADANYLWAEALYRQGKYEKAARLMDKFLLSSHAKQSSYYAQGLYTQGYLAMQAQHYDHAAEYFQQYLKASANTEVHQRMDTYNRLGDCSFIHARYQEAIGYYNRVINNHDKDADYATYQKALSYGALGNVSEKLNNLNYIFERYTGSTYSSKAQLEIAKTYLACDNNDMALLYYKNFITDYPKSAYIKEALLDMGIIYYNESRYDEALATFDRLLTHYSGTRESRSALSTVKDIYIKQNRVEDYFAYVRRTTQMTITTVQEDSITYSAAEDRYMEGQYEIAATSLENYLNRFPNGLSSLQAHYYAADALFRLGRNEQALPHFEFVAYAPKSQYSESAQYNGANIAYNQGDYRRACGLYRMLATAAESDDARRQGMQGQLRCYIRQEQHDSLRLTAHSILQLQKIPADLADEARAALARDCYAFGETDSADLYFRELAANTSNGEYKGEAVYHRAAIEYDRAMHQSDAVARKKALQRSEQIIENLVESPTSDYYLAKAFILWADIYYARGNNLQAKQTLQSIIENYDGDDLKEQARQRLDAIITAETPAAPAEDEAPVIEIDNE